MGNSRRIGVGRHYWWVAWLGTLLGAVVSLTAEAHDTPPIDGVTDNSFLLEEAYNQEPGVVQHIVTVLYGVARDTDPHQRGWTVGFTQEWPVWSQRHQVSYSLPFSFIRTERDHQDGIGDTLLNYRFQALEEQGRLPAVAPRLSLLLPTGSQEEGTGTGVVGFQGNLPLSKKLGARMALHANAGLTYLPGARVQVEADEEGSPATEHLSAAHSLVSYNLGMSSIVALSPRVHVLLEWVGEFEDSLDEAGQEGHDFSAVLSPGLRVAVVNRDTLGVVLGIAVPVGLTRAADEYGVFTYLSVEHGFL